MYSSYVCSNAANDRGMRERMKTGTYVHEREDHQEAQRIPFCKRRRIRDIVPQGGRETAKGVG